MNEIVVSYAHKDRARAEMVVRALTSDGLSVWWDADLEPGEPSYNAAIQRALEGARCVLVLWSAWSVRSEYVAIEAEYARKTRKLLPVLLDDVVDAIPIAFRLAQAADLVRWNGDSAHDDFVKLEAIITSRLGRSPGSLAEKIRELRERVGARVSATYHRLDRWDVVAAGVLSIGAVAGWSLIGRTEFNAKERWLWGVALLLLFATWSYARLCVRSMGSGTRRMARQVAWPSVGLATAIGAWGTGAFDLYRVPRLVASNAGVFVTRMTGDADDRVQSQLVAEMRARVDYENLGLIPVIGIPRHVASDAEARELGRRGGAALVVHGAVSRNSGKDVFTGYLTPVDLPGIFRRSARPTENAAAFARDLPAIRLPKELDALQRVVPAFAAGYERYHADDYRGTLANMGHVARVLAHVPSVTSEVSLSEFLLASAHFYLGNAYAGLGSADSATAHYAIAVEHSLHPGENAAGGDRPQFLPPLNNLGMLLSDAGAGDSAMRVFERAGRECEVDRDNAFCAYVSYNFANVLAEAGRFAEANARYDTAAARVKSAPGDTAGSRTLGAYIHKGRAYAFARLAEGTTDRGERERVYRRAQQEWEAAVAALRAVPGSNVPPGFYITRSRVHIGLGEWDAARRMLDSAQAALPNNPDVFLLRAVVETCAGQMQIAGPLLIALPARLGAAASAGMEEHRTLTHNCQPPS